MTASPKVSIVIPVYNEEQVLPHLFTELAQAFEHFPYSYEIIFVDDGSKDLSSALLIKESQKRKEMIAVILDGNFGQHQAIIAGFSVARGEYIITLDADLQNPPSEIIRLCQEMDKGHDYVGSIRDQRQDVFWRRFLSRINNKIREKITKIQITDQGCMLRGYSRRLAQIICQSQEAAPYLPALGFTLSHNPTEIVVQHQEREAGVSKYSFYKLMRLNFDIMTGYSLVPLQFFSMLGMMVASISGLFFIVLVVRRILSGPEAEGVFTLLALLFFFMGVCLFGMGILGEYVGRVYAEVRRRPRYLIRNVYAVDLDTKKEIREES